MAKKALIEKNKKRIRLIASYRKTRSELKAKIMNKELQMKDRLKLQAKMNSLPINSSAVRKKNRCSITGRPRAFYRKFGVSRIQLRVLAGWGMLPGVVKSSW
jgi:small subunit ribosomal protein S14